MEQDLQQSMEQKGMVDVTPTRRLSDGFLPEEFHTCKDECKNTS